MEEPAPPVGQHAVAQHLQQAGLHIGAEIAGLHADQQLELQRDIDRIVEFGVLAGHAIALDMAGELVLEGVVHGKPAQPVDGDEHGVPAPGPAQRRRRPLHAGMTLGHLLVVRRRDRALLAAEGLRGVAAEDGVALHVDAALGGQRVARRQHIAVGR